MIFGTTIYATNSTVNNIIITPKEIEGLPGERLNIEDIFVQEVGLNKVSILDVKVVDDSDKVVLTFPKTSGKYALINKSNNQKVGYIELKTVSVGNTIPTSNNLRGEYLYFQEGKVFNTLSSAKDGNLYFWQKSNKYGDTPVILNIGEVKEGMFEGKYFVEIINNIIQIKK